MSAFAAIDTGTSRNATTLAGVRSKVTRKHPASAPLWIVFGLHRWQGRPGAPLDIRNDVGPKAAEIVRSWGLSSWACDGIELAAIHHVSNDPRFNLEYRVQGGELGPDEKALTEGGRLGVYGHGKRVIHEGRIVIALDDEEATARLLRGLCAIQAEPVDGGRLKLWLPTEGDSHHDEASAVLRALWFAGAGLDVTPEDPTERAAVNMAMRHPRAPQPLPHREERANEWQTFRHPRAR